MDRDQRKGDDLIPENVDKFLNPAQRAALQQLESFGWQLQLIRRPLFQDPVVVVVNPEGRKLGVLESDGRINMQKDIEFRD
ncbi:hypothetical protein [Zhongshania borealis]|uniref:DUF4224 domain-containing protein n=1 Tax=Zhongshania borealis TaxID=889488 RepID=A0ABP7X7C5_9GAMM